MLVKLHIWLLMLFVPAMSTQIKWVIVSGCKLRISGSTNVNKFGCEVTEYTSADTIVVYNNNVIQQPMIMTGRLSLDVYRFNCMNELMTKDLRKTLKAKEYPRLHIRFLSLGKLPCFRMKGEVINGIVDIELAGVVKKYNIEYTFSKDGHNLITLTGRQQVCFSDFNLNPPRKLGGMVQAKDQLDVLFCLKLKAISNNL
jgi:hypothetical protein